jgi:GT2 family glycosyltransferase
VSILVGMRDRWELTARCIRSIERKTAYEAYEIIIVTNQSAAPATHRFLRAMARRHRVLDFDEPFNYSALNNAAAATARGDHLVLLNNDTEVIGRDWLVAMLEHSQRTEIGAVGARLLYPDGRLQHAGVLIMGTDSSVAGHAFRSFPGGGDYLGRIAAIGNWSAVTGACLMTRRDVFQSIGGLDERYRVAFGDVDFCLRVRESGRLVVYTPLATLLHLESATRGPVFPPEDEVVFRRRWARFFGEIPDPYWNPNLSVQGEAFGLAV